MIEQMCGNIIMTKDDKVIKKYRKIFLAILLVIILIGGFVNKMKITDTLYYISNFHLLKIGAFQSEEILDGINHINSRVGAITDLENLAYIDYEESHRCYLKIYNTKSHEIERISLIFNDKELISAKLNYYRIQRIAVNENNKIIAFINLNDENNLRDCSVIVYNYETKTILYHKKIESFKNYTFIGINNDCSKLLYNDSNISDGTNNIYSLDLIKKTRNTIIKDINCVAISKSGERIAYYDNNENLIVYVLDTGKKYYINNVEFIDNLAYAVFSNDESTLVITSAVIDSFSFSAATKAQVFKWEFESGIVKRVYRIGKLEVVPYFLFSSKD